MNFPLWVLAGLALRRSKWGVAALVILLKTASAQTQPPAMPLMNLTLKHAETLLVQNSRDLRLARQIEEAAHIGIEQAGASPNSTLSWGASKYDSKNGLGPGNLGDKQIDQILSISQTIERGDKRRWRIEQADAGWRGAQADREETLRQARQTLGLVYFDVKLAEERLQLLSNIHQSYQRSLVGARRRVSAGDLAGSDLARLEVDALRAEADKQGARADLRRAQLSLAVLMNIKDEVSAIHCSDAWPDTESMHRFTIGDRPDVTSARQAVLVSQAALRAAQALRHRDITVSAQIERDGTSAPIGNTFGVGISIPLFTGYDYNADARRALLDLESAQVRLERAEFQARNEVDQAQLDAEAATLRHQRYSGELLQSARRAAQSAEFAFTKGAVGVMELLDARRTLYGVEVDALTARSDLAHAVVREKAALASVSTLAFDQ